jgi:hypothetical protein
MKFLLNKIRFEISTKGYAGNIPNEHFSQIPTKKG